MTQTDQKAYDWQSVVAQSALHVKLSNPLALWLWWLYSDKLLDSFCTVTSICKACILVLLSFFMYCTLFREPSIVAMAEGFPVLNKQSNPIQSKNGHEYLGGHVIVTYIVYWWEGLLAWGSWTYQVPITADIRFVTSSIQVTGDVSCIMCTCTIHMYVHTFNITLYSMVFVIYMASSRPLLNWKVTPQTADTTDYMYCSSAYMQYTICTCMLRCSLKELGRKDSGSMSVC